MLSSSNAKIDKINMRQNLIQMKWEICKASFSSYGVNVEESTIFSYSTNIFLSHLNFSFSIFPFNLVFFSLVLFIWSLLEEKVFGFQIFIFKVLVKEPCCYHSFFITSYVSRIQCNLKKYR